MNVDVTEQNTKDLRVVVNRTAQSKAPLFYVKYHNFSSKQIDNLRMHIIIPKNIAKTIMQKDIVKSQQRNSNGILKYLIYQKNRQ